MTPTISTGTQLSVADTLPASYNASGFQALAFTPIRGARTIGDIGKQFQLQTNNAISAPRPVQQRVGLAQQSLAVELFRIADPGQQMLRAAIDAPGSYSYRLVAPDGLTMYFTAAASSRMHGTFQAGSIGDTKLTLEIDSVVVEI